MLTSVAAVFFGPYIGAVYGLLTGAYVDFMRVGSEGFFALIYMLCGFGVGAVCAYAFKRSLVTAFLWAAAVTAAATIGYYCIFFLLTQRAGISAFYTTALPEIGYSVLMTPLVYYPMREIHKLISAKEE